MKRSSRTGTLVAVALIVLFVGFFILALRMDRQADGLSGFRGAGAKIAVLPLEGVILDVRETIEQLDAFVDDASVKAIVLRVDSPGGAVAPSQELYQAIREADAEKPVVTSVGSLCASGGYYAAVGTRHIMANPGSIVGSIGVIMEFVDASRLADWAKLRFETVQSGPFKDIGSPTRPLRPAEQASLQALIDSVYGQFVSAVVEGRPNMTTDAVLAVADGRIYSGEQGLTLGLVDSLGTLKDAVDLAAELGEIEGEPKVVYPPEEKESFFDFLVDQGASSVRKAATEMAVPRLYFLFGGPR